VEKLPGGGRSDAVVCGDELEGFGGGFGHIVVAAGAVKDVSDGQQRAVLGETHAVAREMQQSAKFRWRIGWQVGGSNLRS
jgi:hypothetical protein